MNSKKGKFKEGKAYKHENTRDTFVEVISIIRQSETEAVLKVMYCNIGFTGRPWVLPNPKNKRLPYIENITINADNINKWHQWNNSRDWKPFREKQVRENLK